MTARQAAYQVVLRVFEEDAYADRVLRSAAKDLDGVLILDRTTPEARREAMGALRPRVVIR